MDEKFVYLRDANRRLRATIAYLRPGDDGDIKYSVSIVSPTEPQHTVTPQVGRHKTLVRLSNGEHAKWDACWQKHAKRLWCSTHLEECSALPQIKASGLHKIGRMPADNFRAKVRKLREVIACNEFEPTSIRRIS